MKRKFLSQIFDDKDPVIVTPFGGYASSEIIHGLARVLEDEGISHTEEDGFVKNVFNSFKRFETDEVENALVQITFNHFNWTDNSDKEGYVYVDRDVQLALNQTTKCQWLPIEYSLILNNKKHFSTKSELLMPSVQAQYGVISDLDDTVLNTGISSTFKYKVIINTFFKHSTKRIPLKGALSFYKKLQKGVSGLNDNPFFYLSNSPWNLYEYLKNFLRFYDFPKGVLLLRDIGFENEKKTSFLERNKFLRITHIVESYPRLSFVLIGDAADLDHDIYIEIARRFPNRILAIYIRTVADKKKMKFVKKLIENTTDVQVVLIENSEKAISHAKSIGLIK